MPECPYCFHHVELQSQVAIHLDNQAGIGKHPAKGIATPKAHNIALEGDMLEILKPKVAASAKTSKGENMANKEVKASTILVEFKDGNGNLLGSLVGARRTFSSGSTGYGCYGKIGAKGSSQGYYQVSANIVEVGTKPTK